MTSASRHTKPPNVNHHKGDIARRAMSYKQSPIMISITTIRAKQIARSTSRGFTLFELLVVAALVIVIGGLIYPALMSTTETQSLIRTGDTVRTYFARSRNEAMRSGQTLALRYQIGGNQFVIETWDTGDSSLESSVPASNFNLLGQLEQATSNGRNITKRLLQQVQTLPDKVVFATGTQTFDSRELGQTDPTLNPNAANVATSSVTDLVDVTWSQPILFYPDGSTSQSEVRVATDDLQLFVLIRIRGLTGIAYVTKIMTQTEVFELDATRIAQ
jgi:Tfp pilus assembly protein FimT